MGKLVRDKIPAILRREGREPAVERISGERLRAALEDKLVEEARELQASGDAAELVDVLEVVDALIVCYGLDRAGLDEARGKKRAERGGFEEGFYLKD